MTVKARPAITGAGSGDPARQQGQDTLPTDTTTINFDAGDYSNKVVTITQNSTFTLTTIEEGEKVLIVKSDTLGTYTLDWPANIIGSPPSVVETQVRISMYYDGTDFWID